VSQNPQSLPPVSPPSNAVRSSSWKTAYEKALWESDTKNLLTEIHATEEALFFRWQELGDNGAHAEERVEMRDAAEDLLAIKIHRLGWPDPCH
jgi:hypothetical protein